MKGIDMSNQTVIGAEVSPSTSCKLKCLGNRRMFILNGGGGMGGTREEYIAVSEQEDGNFIQIKLTESNRKIKLGSQWVGRIEEVSLYKRTTYHENPNYKINPLITYFVTKGDHQLLLEKRFIGSNDELKGNKMVEKINESQC
jgi:hypothetical protein